MSLRGGIVVQLDGMWYAVNLDHNDLVCSVLIILTRFYNITGGGGGGGGGARGGNFLNLI